MSHWAIPGQKPNGGWGYTFLTPTTIPPQPPTPSWEILDFLQIPEKIVWHTLEIPRSKTKTNGNSTLFFLEFPWKFHFFLYSSWNFYIFSSMSLEIPWNSIWIFLEQPIIVYVCLLSSSHDLEYTIYTLCTRFVKTWYLRASVILGYSIFIRTGVWT